MGQLKRQTPHLHLDGLTLVFAQCIALLNKPLTASKFKLQTIKDQLSTHRKMGIKSSLPRLPWDIQNPEEEEEEEEGEEEEDDDDGDGDDNDDPEVDALQGEEIPEEEEDKGENDRIPQTQRGKEISEAALQGEEIPEEDQEEKERIPQTQQAAVREVSPRPTQYRPTSGTGSDSDAPQKHSSKRPKWDQKNGARKNKTMKDVVVIGARNKENQKKTSVHPTTSSFARVFTEKDEIDILQGMIDYAKLQNVTDLSAHTNAVYEFLKGKLHFEFTKTQVYGKIRRLKNNYLKILEKRKGSGNDPVFLSPHESISFELSKKLWGGVDFVDDVKSGMKKKKDGKKAMVRKLQLKHDDEVNVEEDQGGFKPNHPFLEESSDVKNLELLWMPESLKVFMRGNMTLMDCEKAKELEVKWKELRRKEIELFLMKLNLRMELINHVLDAMKKG